MRQLCQSVDPEGGLSGQAASAQGLRLQPRGLVNPGNLCFMNAILQVPTSFLCCHGIHQLMYDLSTLSQMRAVFACDHDRERMTIICRLFLAPQHSGQPALCMARAVCISKIQVQFGLCQVAACSCQD